MLIWDAHAGFELQAVHDLETLSVWRSAGVNFLSVNVGYDVNVWSDTVKALSLAREWLSKTDGYRLVGSVAWMAIEVRIVYCSLGLGTMLMWSS